MGSVNQPKSDSFWDQKIPDWMKPIIGIGGMLVIIIIFAAFLQRNGADREKRRAQWHQEVTLSDGRIFKAMYVNVYNAGFFADGESIVFMRTCDGGEITIAGMATTEVRKIMDPCPQKED